MLYLRGEPQYRNDNHRRQLPETVRETLKEFLEAGAPVIPAGRHMISASRAFAYVRGNKHPCATIHEELVADYA